MNIKHVGILNAYDARNRGDRAIVEAQLGWIERTMPGASVTIFSPHYEYNQTIFSSGSCQAPLLGISRRDNFIGRLTKPLVDLAMHCLGRRTDKSSVEFHSCDAFFVCGGGYLYSSPSPLASRQLFLHAANILAALKTGKPVLSFPMSWGPIRKKTDEWICKRLASAMPILVTRGAESTELLTSWGCGEKIVSLPDVVIAAAELLPEVKVWRETPRRTGSMGIAPIDWGFDRKVSPEDMENYLSKLVTLGKEWCQGKEGRSITVFPQVEVDGSDDDRIVARRLITALRDAGLPCQIAEYLDWSDYWKEIAAQEVFVGCRMHSCIFAMVCGVPTVGLGYQPKFQELFEQLGWPSRSHLIDRFSPSDVAAQLKTLSTDEGRQEMLRHIDHVGQHLIKLMDEAWRRTIAICSSQKSKTSNKDVRFSIITPSFKQVNYLKCCAASVRDQQGNFQAEHLVHDGGSGKEFTQWAASQQGAVCVSESDDGMYDAINRGFRKAGGDIIAWLNCDEQYLPGTLERVANYFEAHPETDILFGDVVLVDEIMTPLAYRRAVLPSVGHIRHSHLSTFSAATFVRKRVLDEGHYLQTRWKTIADAVWIEELLTAGYQAAILSEPLAIFCMLGSNLGQSTLLFEERVKWEVELGATSRWSKRWHIFTYRLDRLRAGAYLPRKMIISAYTLGSRNRGKRTRWLFGQWNAAREEAANLRSWRDGTMGKMMKSTRQSRWSLLHAVCLIAAAISIDRITQGDAVKGPFILLLSLMFLSFRTPLKDMILIAISYFLTSGYLLSERPTDVMIVRLGTFTLGATLAIFWSTSQRNLLAWAHGTIALIRQIPGPIILTDGFGKIILVNYSACKILGSNETRLLNYQMSMTVSGTKAEAKPLSIHDWGDRPPAGVLELVMRDGYESTQVKASVLVLGKGQQRFYAFIIPRPDVE